MQCLVLKVLRKINKTKDVKGNKQVILSYFIVFISVNVTNKLLISILYVNKLLI